MERGREGGRRGEENRAQQCYLMDQFVINLLPQAVIVCFCSVKGVCLSGDGKRLLAWTEQQWMMANALHISAHLESTTRLAAARPGPRSHFVIPLTNTASQTRGSKRSIGLMV